MKRWIAALILLLIGLGAYLQFAPQQSMITITNAMATPMGAGGQMFMVTLDMQNKGPAVTLTGVSSPSGAEVSVMNANQVGPLVVPQNSDGLLAMDGAHIMLSVPAGHFQEGAFQSISLMFDDGTEVATRVMHQTADGGMRHGMAHGVMINPAPKVTLLPPESISTDGFDVTLDVENFAFVLAEDGAAHVPNQGHAHIYLNGLKLGRLYSEDFTVGGLKSGTYTLQVGLNTNDHRPYVTAQGPIGATFVFQIP